MQTAFLVLLDSFFHKSNNKSTLMRAFERKIYLCPSIMLL